MTNTPEKHHKVAKKDREIASLREQLEVETATLERLISLSKALSNTVGLDSLLSLIMVKATDLLQVETTSLLLLDDETNELTFDVVTGHSGKAVVRYTVPPGQGIAGWVVEHKEPIVVNDPSTNTHFFPEIDKATGFKTRNLLAVPLLARDRTIGAIEMINKLGDSSFDERDVSRAEALASYASVAIENARMHARLTNTIIRPRVSYRL